VPVESSCWSLIALKFVAGAVLFGEEKAGCFKKEGLALPSKSARLKWLEPFEERFILLARDYCKL
jgi:hypothetical protein